MRRPAGARVAVAAGLLAVLWLGAEWWRLAEPGHPSTVGMEAGALNGHTAHQLYVAGQAPAQALLAVSALLAMAPCLLQMTVILVGLWCQTGLFGLDALPPTSRLHRAAPAALAFLAGYVGLFLPAMLGLALTARHAGPWITGLRAVGGAVLLLLAARALGVGPRPWRSHPAGGCAGPGSLLARQGVSRPARLGASYAIYCTTCCAPYLLGGTLVAATPSGGWPWLGPIAAHLALAFLPVALPLLWPRPWHLLWRLAPRQPWLGRAAAWGLSVAGLYLLASPWLLA